MLVSHPRVHLSKLAAQDFLRTNMFLNMRRPVKCTFSHAKTKDRLQKISDSLVRD